jgi:hypothetical protein
MVAATAPQGVDSLASLQRIGAILSPARIPGVPVGAPLVRAAVRVLGGAAELSWLDLAIGAGD